MVKRNEVFPSRFLKAADLAGKPLIVKIERAPIETLGSGDDADRKTVLYFRGGTKALVGSSRVDLQACKLEYSIVSPK